MGECKRIDWQVRSFYFIISKYLVEPGYSDIPSVHLYLYIVQSDNWFCRIPELAFSSFTKPLVCQAGATSVRDRMDHLYNNPDMADLQIVAVDELWSWGQTSKDFIVKNLCSKLLE